MVGKRQALSTASHTTGAGATATALATKGYMDETHIRARGMVSHLSKQISCLLSSMTHVVAQLLLLP